MEAASGAPGVELELGDVHDDAGGALLEQRPAAREGGLVDVASLRKLLRGGVKLRGADGRGAS